VPLYVHGATPARCEREYHGLLEVKFSKGWQEGPHGHGATPGLRKRYRGVVVPPYVHGVTPARCGREDLRLDILEVNFKKRQQ
jgi:hypothetical protein